MGNGGVDREDLRVNRHAQCGALIVWVWVGNVREGAFKSVSFKGVINKYIELTQLFASVRNIFFLL